MMNIFKLCTQSGRRSIASDAWDAVVTPEGVTGTVAEQVTKVLAESDLPLGKAVAIAEYAGKATDVVQELFKAAEDKVITYEEANAILTKVFDIFGANLADTLKALKDKVIEKIP